MRSVSHSVQERRTLVILKVVGDSYGSRRGPASSEKCYRRVQLVERRCADRLQTIDGDDSTAIRGGKAGR